MRIPHTKWDPKSNTYNEAPLIKPKVIVKTELKVNVASSSGNKEKKKDVSADVTDDEEETIIDAMKRKKRDKELDETLQIAREEEEKERKKKEEHDTLVCKQALFPPWTRETLIKEAIEFPSTYWLEPVTSFDCQNTRDL